jgi:hypothetical protein
MTKQQIDRSGTTEGIQELLKEYLSGDSSSSGRALVSRRSDSIIKLAAVAFTAALSSAEPRRVGFTSATSLPRFGVVEGVFRSATDEQATQRRLREQIARVLARAFHEEFREGMPSEFADDLRTLVLDYGTAVVAELQRMIALHGMHPGVGGVGFEALNTLASFDYSSIAADRFRLIEWALASPSPEVRYGAALAVATLREAAAVGPLEVAIKHEAIPDLRRAFEKVLRKLMETRSGGASL